MVYMGSKSKIAKYIVPIITDCIKNNCIKYYYEPFIGGANIFDKIHIDGLYKDGSDLQRYLIRLLNYGLYCGRNNQEPDFPTSVPKDFYDICRKNYRNNMVKPDSDDELVVAAIGFFASYNGRFFDGGYGAKSVKANGEIRDMYDERKRNFIKQIPNLIKGNVTEYFKVLSYEEAIQPYLDGNIKPTTFFYIDPPYANTQQYNVSKNFNYDVFWGKMRQLSKKHYVIISEMTAPDDFNIKLTISASRTLNNQNHKDATEKLFYYSEGLFADYNGSIEDK